MVGVMVPNNRFAAITSHERNGGGQTYRFYQSAQHLSQTRISMPSRSSLQPSSTRFPLSPSSLPIALNYNHVQHLHTRAQISHFSLQPPLLYSFRGTTINNVPDPPPVAVPGAYPYPRPTALVGLLLERLLVLTKNLLPPLLVERESLGGG